MWAYLKALALLVLFLAHATVAADIWVDGNIGLSGNTAGCGSEHKPCGTIKYAIGQASACNLDVVLVQGHTYSDPDDLDLRISATNITFRASGNEAPTTIDCGGRSRFISVINPDSSTTVSIDLGLAGLTITNCKATGSNDGGAVEAVGIVNVNITDCKFTNNQALNGGAICLSDVGRARAAKAPLLTVSGNCLFQNNSASQFGGAIKANYSKVFVSGTTFTSNSAGVGGGIWILSPYTLTVLSSTFKLNVALDGGVDGGSAIFATSALRATIHNVLFDGNRARGKGTVGLEFGPNALMQNVRFVGNSARSGGGIFVGPQATLNITDGVFFGNSATRGGAIACAGTSRTQARGITAAGNSAAFGGAIYFENTVSSLYDSYISNNEAESGGGIYSTIECRITVQNATLVGNHARHEGAGFYCDMSTYKLYEITFINNTYGSGASSKAQDFFCDTEEQNGFCYLEGDGSWSKHCALNYGHSTFPLPKWFIGLLIGVSTFIIFLIIGVAFCTYRIRKARMLAGGSSGAEYAPLDSSEASTGNELFDVITNPNALDTDYLQDENEANDSGGEELDYQETDIRVPPK